MLGGGGNPAAWWEVGGERTGHDASGTADGVVDDRPGQRLHRDLGRRRRSTSPADAWWAPIETVSNSENGFERVYQGSGLLLSWPLRLGARRALVAYGRRTTRVDRDRADDRALERGMTRPRARRPRPLLPAAPARPVHRARCPLDPTAAPARDWNARISADCYRPNAELGNLGAMSWDLGPTLAGWLADRRPGRVPRVRRRATRGVNGMAQPFHHTILPLASAADRRTEIRWGLRDFELRFGRRPTGMWLPETAVDLATLRLLADEGVTHTILAPWQVDGRPTSTRAGPSASTSATGARSSRSLYDAACCRRRCRSSRRDRRRRPVRARAARAAARREPLADGEPPPLVVIATDGELYGHHQPFRDLFLARLVGRAAPPTCGYDAPSLADAVARRTAGGLPDGRLRRADVVELPPRRRALGDGLRLRRGRRLEGAAAAALDRLAGGIDAADRPARRGPAGRAGPVGGPRRLRRRRRRGDRRRRVRRRSGSAADADGRRPRDVPRPHGGAALAAGDVRELRAGSGSARSDRDRRS